MMINYRKLHQVIESIMRAAPGISIEDAATAYDCFRTMLSLVTPGCLLSAAKSVDGPPYGIKFPDDESQSKYRACAAQLHNALGNNYTWRTCSDGFIVHLEIDTTGPISGDYSIIRVPDFVEE